MDATTSKTADLVNGRNTSLMGRLIIQICMLMYIYKFLI